MKRQPPGIADWVQRRRARANAVKADAFVSALSDLNESVTSVFRRWGSDGLTIRNKTDTPINLNPEGRTDG